MRSPSPSSANGSRYFDPSSDDPEHHHQQEEEKFEGSKQQAHESSSSSRVEEGDEPRQSPPGGGGGPPPKHDIFEPAFKSERIWMMKYTAFTIVVMCTGILALLSIYWGSYYQRETRMHNLTTYVYNLDQGTDELSPVVGDTLVKNLMPGVLGWEVKHDNLTVEEVKSVVHEEEAWIAIYIRENATASLYNALANADQSFNKTDLITVIYERERDLTTVSSYLPVLTALEEIYQLAGAKSIYPPMLKALSSKQRDSLMTGPATALLTIPLQFTKVDLSEYSPAILLTVLQVGLIYLIIIAFFQFNFFAPLHMRVGPKLTPKSSLIYRPVISLISYFFASLAIALVSLAFQIDMTLTYGKGGFLVFWMTLFLTMIACGQAIENLAMLAIAVWAPLIGFILLFFVIAQISPSFSPLELCPQFYHYGWIFPIFNAAQILRVVLVGTTAKNMGKNYGIIVAWIVADYLFFPICLMVFGKAMAKQAMKTKK